MITRAISPPRKNSFFLLGPRGTGKSFFVRETFKNSLYINLLDDATYQRLLASPSSLEDRIPAQFKEWVIIDEIQKIPALLDKVHQLIEEKKFKFILTGSSARKLKKSGTNLLAGRAFQLNTHPLTALELGPLFDLKKALKIGLLPKAYLEEDSSSYLAAYVGTYLREEIKDEGLTRNLAGFARFLETASFSQGQVLNYTKIGKECHVDRKTVTNYFEILNDLMLAHFLDVFSHRAKRELLTQRKLYFFDVGVFRQLRPVGPLDSESEVMGPALESIVLNELISRNEYQGWNYKIGYWHTAKHVEVDFILYGKRGLRAIEVKSSQKLRDEDFFGLLEFKKDYPQADLFYVYGGKEEKFHKEIRIIPAEKFLLQCDKFL